VELHQFEPTVAVRGLHHRVLHPDALEPHHAVHPTALDLPFSLQRESEFDEDAVAASRSSTTMPTCSMRWIVMLTALTGGRVVGSGPVSRFARRRSGPFVTSQGPLRSVPASAPKMARG